MDDASVTSKLESPAPLAKGGLDAITSTFADALDRSSAVFNAGLRYWQAETLRFLEDAAVQGQARFARLCNSKTPLDVLQAEQEWLRARSRSAFDAGARLVDAMTTAAQVGRGGSAALVAAPAKVRKAPG